MTKTIFERLKKIGYTEEEAEKITVFMDNAGRVKDSKEKFIELCADPINTNYEIIRKVRTMSEETRRKNYEQALAKIREKYQIND